MATTRARRKPRGNWGCGYEPYVARSEQGSKRLDYMFSTARAIAHHDILCYVNCDIILMDDFLRALKRVREERTRNS